MKRVLAVLVTLAMVFTLGACSNGGNTAAGGTATSEPAASGEKIQVTIWHTYTEDQQKCLEDAAAAFNASQEAVEVVVQSQPYDAFTSTVMTAVTNGNGPDIIIHYASEAANYVTDGLVADIGAMIANADTGIADYEASVAPGAYAEATDFADGKMHILPLVTSGPVFFYNKTVYEELGLTVPTTWTELAANAEAIHAAHPEVAGFAFDSLSDGMAMLLIQHGAGYIDEAAKTVAYNNETGAAQFQWFADEVNSGAFMLAPTGDYFSNDFNSGILASYIGSVAGIPYLSEDIDWGVAAVPQEGGTAWAPAWNRGIIIFSSTPEKEEAAFQFAKFFADSEWNTKFCIASNYASPYKATQDNADYQAFLADNEGLNCLSIDIAGALPIVTGASAVRTALQEAATQAATGTDVQAALDATSTEANAELQAE